MMKATKDEIRKFWSQKDSPCIGCNPDIPLSEDELQK